MAYISASTNIDSIQLQEQASAPTTPGTGYGRIYCKSDGLYFVGDNGTEVGPLAAATSAPAFVGARYTSDAGQTITNNASPAIVNFEDQVYDTDTLVTVGAAWKFTAPANGYYHVDSVVVFAAAAGWIPDERAWMQLFKNNASVATLDRVDWNGANATPSAMALSGSITVYLAAGDYIDIRVSENSGGNIALSNSALNAWINIDKVS